jgi:hypothetical protein
MKLGAEAASYRGKYRKHKLDASDAALLSGLGFAFDNNDWKWEHRVQSALVTYKEVHGNLNVPVAFVVSSSTPWAEETWGMRLGDVVHNIRAHGQYLGDDKPERKEWLDEMGFVWDDHERSWKIVTRALTVYKEEHGHLNVPQAFEVPSRAPWRKDTWGVKLGCMVNVIRSHGIYLGRTVLNIRELGDFLSAEKPERREWLDEMGFVWDEYERRWDLTQSALTTYAEEHGDLMVPYEFVVPSSAPWAEDAWGISLGAAVNDIRTKGIYLSDEKPERRYNLLIDWVRY